MRKSLVRCGISSKHAMQPIGTLSGGEQAKDALKVALEEFPGTVLLVSHDEDFYREWFDKDVPVCMEICKGLGYNSDVGN